MNELGKALIKANEVNQRLHITPNSAQGNNSNNFDGLFRNLLFATAGLIITDLLINEGKITNSVINRFQSTSRSEKNFLLKKLNRFQENEINENKL